MTSLSQSAFLQALGWAIANSLWQMALLWAIYQLCFVAFRRALASVKTTAATLMLFTGFIWFLWSLIGHYWLLQSAGGTAGAVAATTGYSLTFTGFRVDSFRFYMNDVLGRSQHYLPYLSFAYLLVLAFLLVRVGKAYRHIQEIRTEGLAKIDVHWKVYVQDLAYRLGISREIRVWLSDKIDIPATVGYLKPLVLLPIASFNHLTTEQVEAILLHELAHIKRHDYLLNLVITVVETILFFNPFAQLITRHIKTERENSCDDFVLQFQFSPRAYAAALLSLEKQRMAPELAMMAAGKTDLLDRIKRIMNVQTRPMNYGQKLMALVITACILSSLAWLTPEIAPVKPVSAGEGLAVLSVPVREAWTDPVWKAPEPGIPVPLPAANTKKECNAARSARPGPANIHHTEMWETVQAPRSDLKHNTTDPTASDAADVVLDGPDNTWSVSDSLLNLNMNQVPLNVNVNQLKVNLTRLKLDLGRLDVEKATKTMAVLTETARLKLALAKAQMTLKLVQDNQNNQDLAEGKVYYQSSRVPSSGRSIFVERSVPGQRSHSKTRRTDDAADQYWAGIQADQPGWQAPDEEALTVRNFQRNPAAAVKVITARFNMPLQQTVSTFKGMTNYKEKITLYKSPRKQSATVEQSTLFQAPDAKHAYINYFLQKLAKDGVLPQDSLIRIIRDDNALIINDKIQSEALYSRYKPYFSGKSILIVTNGQTIQISID